MIRALGFIVTCAVIFPASFALGWLAARALRALVQLRRDAWMTIGRGGC